MAKQRNEGGAVSLTDEMVVTVRLPARWVARLDRLTEKFAEDHDLLLGVKGVSRSLAIRLSLGEGVKVLENKYDCPDDIEPVEEWIRGEY